MVFDLSYLTHGFEKFATITKKRRFNFAVALNEGD